MIKWVIFVLVLFLVFLSGVQGQTFKNKNSVSNFNFNSTIVNPIRGKTATVNTGGMSALEKAKSTAAQVKAASKNKTSSTSNGFSQTTGTSGSVNTNSQNSIEALIKKKESVSVKSINGDTLPKVQLKDVPISPGSKITVKKWVPVD